MHIVKLVVPNTIESQVADTQRHKEQLQKKWDAKLCKKNGFSYDALFGKRMAKERQKTTDIEQILSIVICINSDENMEGFEVLPQITDLNWNFSK